MKSKFNECYFDSDSFRIAQDNEYYRIEQIILKKYFYGSTPFQLLCKQLIETTGSPLKSSQHVLKNFIDAFGLHDVKFKITKRKNYSSYYDVSKDTVFVNQDDVNRFKKNKNYKTAKDLLFVVIHECIHAYTNMRVDDTIYHDSVYLINAINMYHYIAKYDKESVINDVKNETRNSIHLFFENTHYQTQIFESMKDAKTFCVNAYNATTKSKNVFKTHSEMYQFNMYRPDIFFEFKYENISWLVNGAIFIIGDKYHSFFYDSMLKRQLHLEHIKAVSERRNVVHKRNIKEIC